MSIVRPFKAVRPDPKLADKVAALPYDVMNSNEAREMVKDNPYSFLFVDKAEISLDPSIDLYDAKVYEKAASNLKQMISDKVFIQDEKPCLYIYRLTMNGRPQTGIVGCTSIDEYEEGKIKKHEHTRADKEIDRIKHVDITNAHTGPIFLSYRAKAEINAAVDKWVKEHEAAYNFVADDDVRHEAWVVDCANTIAKIQGAFAEVPALYIADGHHRNASAVKVGLKRREANPNYDKEAEFNFYLSVIFPDDQLYIMDYNRVVKDLNGLSDDEFMSKVKEKFDVTDSNDGIPKKLHTFGMYLNKKWYALTAKPELIIDDPIEALDVSILQKQLLFPILGIDDPRTNKRIDFVGGIRGLKELERRVDSGEMKVAFAMFPTSMDELLAVADAGEVMPPKSTWFEPKLRSGMFVHLLD
ncbi:MAG: DUF1015 family protein [Defluviitaleaceae bacterium]|nr:DUF1015 family protein [Defluviitaleaceae bacterium]